MRRNTRMPDKLTQDRNEATRVIFLRKRSITQNLAAILLPIGLSLATMPAEAQSFASPSDLAKATHQMAVPAGPYSMVNTGTGSLITNIPIVTWKTCGGMEINFALSTVSGDSTPWYGMPAHGWRHSYHSWVGYSTLVNRYQWCSPTDSNDWNYITSAGTYQRWTGNPNNLSGNHTSGPFAVTAKDQTSYNFSQSSGGYQFLTSIVDTHYNTINLSYGSSNTNLVTRVTDPTGRYLDFAWETGGSDWRLDSITVRNSNGSAVAINGVDQTYRFVYNNSGIWDQLLEIDFPSPNGSGACPKIKFTYGIGEVQVYCITSLTVYKDSDATPLVWTYSYDSLTNRVTEVDGPNADEGQNSSSPTMTKTMFDYPNMMTIGSHGYTVCRVLDAEYTGNKNLGSYAENWNDPTYRRDSLHREVHLYSNSSGDFFDKFGPSIACVVGARSNSDATGSSYDSAMSAKFPGCYYAEYAWNDSAGSAEYDGTLKSYTDQDGNAWSYKWHNGTTTDNRLNIWSITSPRGTTSYQYNAQNRLTQTQDASGHTVNNDYYATTYDLYHTYVDSSGADLITTYGYDSYGNRTDVTDPYGHHIQTAYDTTYHSYPIKKTDIQTGIYSEISGYDALGKPGSSTAPRGSSAAVLTTQYIYDGLDRLTTTTNPDNTTTITTYDLSCDNVSQVQDENGKIKTFAYDNLGHVKQETSSMQNGSSTADTAVTITHCYDELGLLKYVHWNRSGSQKAITYAYDERNRLIQETFPGTQPGWFKYKYDGRGHVTQRMRRK